jgi:hypothetical protein
MTRRHDRIGTGAALWDWREPVIRDAHNRPAI